MCPTQKTWETDIAKVFAHLRHLARSNARPFLVEDILQLDGEDLAILIVLLGPWNMAE